jgi:VCBS repeat-containing protein
VVEDGLLLASGTLGVRDADLGDTAAGPAGPASYGSAAVDPDSGAWTYTLDNSLEAVQGLGEGGTLADSFDITVTDGDGQTDTRTINIIITGTADGNPTASADTVFTNAGSGSTLALQNAWLLRNDVDPTDDPLGVGTASDGLNVDQVAAGSTTTSIRTNIAVGGAGNFSYTATDGALSSGPADVTVSRGAADNAIAGGAGDDILIDGRTDQVSTTLDGGAGSDIIVGGSTANTIVADQADLLIDGGSGSSTLDVALAFDDVSDAQIVNVERAAVAVGGTLNLAEQTEGFIALGSAGAETIVTGAGNDTITGGLGADILTSGAGNDVFVFNALGGAAGSSDSSRVHVTGNGNDRGQDTIVGFDFTNDVIRIVATNLGRFEHGIDTRVGSAGASDTGGSTSFTTATGLIDLTGDSIHDDPPDIAITFGGLSGALDENAFQARLQYKMTGTSGADGANVFLGGNLNDVLNGAGNFDTIRGGAGDDILIGGSAGDRMNGNAGADQYWVQLDAQTDILETYSTIDRIGLRAGDSSFANTVGSVNGTALNAADFASRASFTTTTAADSHKVIMMTTAQSPTATVAGLVDSYVVLFNSAAGGQLWYDADWSDTAGRMAVASFDDIDTLSDFNATFSLADFVVWTNGIDPIILDVDDDGFSFAGLDDGRRFDLDGDGSIDTVAWNTSSDGMLAMDLDGNGLIDNGAELFTPDFAHRSFATGGAALTSLDGNGDGVLDAGDAAFADLLLWRDANADGISDAGEIISLWEAGLASIQLPVLPGEGEIDGQEVIGSGRFTRTDGSVGAYVEVTLEADFGSIDPFFGL